MRFLRKQLHVLVCGSIHLDVFGDFSGTQKRRIDKEGEVHCSIGGSAFNVAVNIANEGGINVALFTHVRANSPVTDIIFSRLRQEGVSRRYVVKDPHIHRDSGFIAHRADGELMSAVSSMPVEDAVIDLGKLKSAIASATVVVAECNLSSTQLAAICKLCQEASTPLVVSGVSESKSRRITLINDTALPIRCFLLNHKEAKAVLGKDPGSGDATALCSLCSSREVVVTYGINGWAVFFVDGRILSFEAPKVAAVRSTSGAGDAVVAAVAHYLAVHGVLDWKRVSHHVHRFVANVLRKRVASGADLTSVETLASAYQQRLADTFKTQGLRIGAILGAIVALLGLVAGLIQASVSLETSTRVWPAIKSAFCHVLPAHSVCRSDGEKQPGTGTGLR